MNAAQLLVGRTISVLGKATGISLAAAGNGTAFKVPLSARAIIAYVLLDNFSAFPPGMEVPTATLSYGTVATTYSDLYSAPINTRGVASVVVTAAGSSYTTDPTVTFLSQDSGGGATGTVTRSGNGVSAVTVTNPGAGYVLAPLCSFTGGGGSGAGATAILGLASGVVPITLAPPQPRLVSGGVSVNWAVTNQVTGGGTCDATWLGSLI